MNLMQTNLLLFLIVWNVDLSHLKPKVSHCVTTRPCNRACANGQEESTPKITFPNLPTSQPSMTSVYCGLGRCFCPQERIDPSKCRLPTQSETQVCTTSEMDSIPGIPSSFKPPMTIGQDTARRLTICKVKGLLDKCRKKRHKDRYYCVYPTSPSTNPILPGMGSFPKPPVKNSTGQSSSGG